VDRKAEKKITGNFTITFLLVFFVFREKWRDSKADVKAGQEM